MMNWTEFVSACDQFLALSEQCGDSWSAEGDPTKPGEYFISLRALRESKTEVDDEEDDNDKGPDYQQEEQGACPRILLSCRFDVIFSLSYSVPVMYFKISKSDGSCMSIQEIWKLVKVSSPDLWSTVSQMDHPVLQVPFYTFHPCQTEKLMESLLTSPSEAGEEGDNKTKVDKLQLQPHELLISWLSFMASILQFNFSQQYIVHCSRQTSSHVK